MKVARSQRGKGFQALGKEIDTDEIIHVIRTRPTLATLSLISRTVLDAELLVLNPSGTKFRSGVHSGAAGGRFGTNRG